MTRALLRSRVWKWVGVSLAAVLALFVLILAVLDWKPDELRGPIARTLSAKLGRPVRLEKHLELQLLSLHPHAVINGIAIANPDWVGHGDLARVGRLELQLELLPLLRGAIVLPLLEVENADVNLIRDAAARANWRFGTPSGRSRSNTPTKLPLVRSFSLKGAHLDYADQTRKLKLTGELSASEGGDGHAWARLKGKGEANGQPFTLAVTGQPLRNIRIDRPYILTFAVRGAGTGMNGRVTIANAFDLGSLQAEIDASGEDLADLYHITRLALPNTAPYSLTARVRRDGAKVQVDSLNGKVGSSDLRGTLTIDTANKRPLMLADIASRSLSLADIAPAFGTRVPGAKTAKAPPRAGKPVAARHPAVLKEQAPELLFPDAPLDPQRIRGMDADVHYRANSIQANKVPLKQVAFRLRLDDGVLSVDPLAFTLTQGRLAGSVKMDASRAIPEVAADIRFSDMHLSQFHPKNGPPPLDGIMVGRALLHGRGASVHAVVSTADGTVTAAVPHGEIRAAFAELTGIDVARGLGLLLARNQQNADVRCGVADFQALKGTLVAKSLVFDTRDVLVTGKGEIDLGTERLDLSLQGQPKKWHLVRVKSPIVLRGTLLKPSIRVDAGKTLGQGSVAAGLATLLSPVAAVLAFIDPGLAKNADCSALLDEAKKSGVPLKTASTASAPAPAAANEP